MNEFLALDDLSLWTLLVAFVSPLALAGINRVIPSSTWRSVAALGFYVVVGAVTAFFTGAFEGREVISSILLVFVVGFTSYRALWKPAGVAGTISGDTPVIEGQVISSEVVPDGTGKRRDTTLEEPSGP